METDDHVRGIPPPSSTPSWRSALVFIVCALIAVLGADSLFRPVALAAARVAASGPEYYTAVTLTYRCDSMPKDDAKLLAFLDSVDGIGNAALKRSGRKLGVRIRLRDSAAAPKLRLASYGYVHPVLLTRTVRHPAEATLNGGVWAETVWGIGIALLGAGLAAVVWRVEFHKGTMYKPRPSEILRGFLYGCLIHGAFVALDPIQVRLLGQMRPEISISDFANVMPAWAQMRFLFLSTVGAAVGEELMWRAGVFRGLCLFAPPWVAALVSAAGFAWWHQQPQLMITRFVAGLILAWVYHRDGRIAGAMTAHAMTNVLAFASALAFHVNW